VKEQKAAQHSSSTTDPIGVGNIVSGIRDNILVWDRGQVSRQHKPLAESQPWL